MAIVGLLSIGISQSAMSQAQENQQISTGVDLAGVASPSVEGARKSKALSIKYNVIASYEINSVSELAGIPNSMAHVRRLNEFEIKMKLPLILKPRTKLILGLKYQLEEYNFRDPSGLNSDINENLNDKNLHALSLDINYLKSINDGNYFLARGQFALNGDYSEGEFPLARYIKFLASGAYGWKLNPRNSLAIGLSLNYTLGRPTVYPIVLWNKTFNQKWGFESVLPARFLMRHTITEKSILLLGYELQGNSYHLTIDNPPLSEFPALELRRSDLLTKLAFEREIYDFLWISVDLGYRYNINFDLSKDNSFDNQAILSNEVSSSMFFNVNLFVVPPNKLATKYLKGSGIQ